MDPNPIASLKHNDNMPYQSAFAITPADGANLANFTKAICLGAAGTVKVDMVGEGTGITLTLPVGITRVAVKKVYATGTTATGIVGLQ